MMLRPAYYSAVLALALGPIAALLTGCGANYLGLAAQSGTAPSTQTTPLATPVGRGPVSTTCLRSDGFLDLLETTRAHLLETVDALGPAQPPTHISNVRAAVSTLRGEASTLLSLGREFADYPDCDDPAVGDLLDSMGAELVTLATHLDLIDLETEVDEADLKHLERVNTSTARILRLLEGLDRSLTADDE